MAGAPGAIERVFREESGAVLAFLIRVLGDFDLAEDALQDAFARAVKAWPEDGIPERPGAWITTAAKNRAVDLLRRSRASPVQRGLDGDLSRELEGPAFDPAQLLDRPLVPDDQLRLIFTCCHPALSRQSQVALTLRTLGGLSTAEIARAFLSEEVAMAQRLVRAKKKIKDAKIPYRVPEREDLEQRIPTVLEVVYLIFNEGYSAAEGGDLLRADLSQEAIRLGRILVALLPEEAEVLGLSALMLLHDARREARIDPKGDLVPLEEQDRSLWNRLSIEEGSSILDRAMAQRRPGPYQIQAAIAALHAEAPVPEATDWLQIAELYRGLFLHQPTPVVALNLAAAVGMAEGPERGLQLLDDLRQDPDLAGYHLLSAARADLLRRARRIEEAKAAYASALALVKNEREKKYLLRRMKELGP